MWHRIWLASTARHVTVTESESGLCCCVPCLRVTSTEHYYFPLFVASAIMPEIMVFLILARWLQLQRQRESRLLYSACDVFVFTYRGVMADTCLFWSVSEMILWRIRIYFGLYLSLYNGEHIFISVCTRSDVIENTYLFWSLPVEMLRYVMGNSCYFGLYPSWYNGEYVLILVFACRDIMGNMSLFWSLPAVMWLGTCFYFGLYTYRNVMGNVYLYWILAVVM